VTPGRLRVLVITKVFPNAREPLAAPFNRRQFAALGQLADVEVVAPVPWFPGAGLVGARTGAGRLHDVPDFAWVDGIFVRHPRIWHLPRIDHAAAATAYGAAFRRHLRRWRGRFDVVLGSFVYPDGVAAVRLGRRLGIPAVVGALGTDLNVTARMTGVTAQVRQALSEAARVVAVSRDLADQAVALGASSERVVTVPNGVDRELFCPRDRSDARRALSRGDDDAPWIVFVGRLERAKGVDDLLAAFGAGIGNAKLFFIGDGSALDRCARAAAAQPGRIQVLGALPPSAVATWMAAADVVTLPSHGEGTPNVLIEAGAVGRKVVATAVGGIPALVTAPALGILVPPHDPPALAAALARALADPGLPATILAAAAAHVISWQDSAARLLAVLQDAVRTPESASASPRSNRS
jgi:teichuronic acid biosynthesis glycosyltransferase TuaC